MYQELIDKCKQAYQDRNMELACSYWSKIHEILFQKTDNSTSEEEKQHAYNEHFEYMRQFTDKEVYDITDYGKEKAYKQMFYNKYQQIELGEELEDLVDFCNMYDWQPVKTDNGYNIMDMQLDKLVDEEDYQDLDSLINRIVVRAIDYFRDEQEWDEDDEDAIRYGLGLYEIARKYPNGTKWEEEWLENFKKELKS